MNSISRIGPGSAPLALTPSAFMLIAVATKAVQYYNMIVNRNADKENQKI